MHEDIHSLLPLTPTVFHMLLALADGEKHGYGIMRAVEEETQGQMQIRTGSLYGAIRRMIEAGLIEETNDRHRLCDGGHSGEAHSGRGLKCEVTSGF
jgi:DNA-binding MarR family transcriptional regulator